MSLHEINAVVLSGRVDRPPVFRYTARGLPILEFDLAYEPAERCDGDDSPTTIRCRCYGKAAAQAERDLAAPGTGLVLTARITTDAWTGKNSKTYSKIVLVVAQFTAYPPDPTSPEARLARATPRRQATARLPCQGQARPTPTRTPAVPATASPAAAPGSQETHRIPLDEGDTP